MLDYERIDKGSPIEGLSVPALTRSQLARFAGAIDDYNPMHLDDKVASAAGKTSVFAPGDLVMAQIGRMVSRWFAGTAIRRFGLRMLKLVWPGDVLTCRGVVVDKREEDGRLIIDADVWADNQRGETVAKGRVLAVLPRDVKRGLTRGEASIGIVYVPKEVADKLVGKKPRKGGADGAAKKSKKAAAAKKGAGKKTSSKKGAAAANAKKLPGGKSSSKKKAAKKKTAAKTKR